MFKILIYVSALLLIACDATPPPVYNKLPENPLIMAFGDSLTFGSGAKKDQSYPAILSHLTGYEVINLGVPGEITQTGLSRLPAQLDEWEPDLLILIHGGNDLLRKRPRSETINNLTAMIQLAQQKGIPVVMLGVPEPSLFLLESADFYAQVAENTGIPVDLETLPDILEQNELKSDTIHPNAEGYRIIANRVLELMIQSGAV